MTNNYLVFGEDFLSAKTRGNQTIKFSKHERLLLQRFTQCKGKLLSREQLLDAVYSLNSDRADRNIDYIINRLRRKLGDTPKRPRFIATQYGEGYVWVASEPSNQPLDEEQHQELQTKALLFISPVCGLEHLSHAKSMAESCIEELVSILQARFKGERHLVRFKDHTHNQPTSDFASAFTLDINMVETGSDLFCVLTLKTEPSDRIVAVEKIKLSHCSAQNDINQALNVAANTLHDHLWRSLTYRDDQPRKVSDIPLNIKLDDTAYLLSPGTKGFEQIDKQLRQALVKNPHDAHSKILLATNIHTTFLEGMTEDPASDENEIERLVLEALPHVQDDALFQLAAAKLLFFTAKGYEQLAEKIIDDAIVDHVTYAAAFATAGQIKSCLGNIAEGTRFLDMALQLGEPGSQFQQFLYSLKCKNYLAEQRWQDSEKEKARMFDAKNEAEYRHNASKSAFNLILSPGDLSLLVPGTRDFLASQSLEHVQQCLRLSFYVSTRHYRLESHRENIQRGFLTLAIEQFGADVIIPELRQSMPRLCGELSD